MDSMMITLDGKVIVECKEFLFTMTADELKVLYDSLLGINIGECDHLTLYFDVGEYKRGVVLDREGKDNFMSQATCTLAALGVTP